MPGDVEASYRWCRELARRHYENFPVGSLLVPRSLRDNIYALYAWSRTADDIADEGTMVGTERVARLNGLEADLELARTGVFSSNWPFLPALVDTMRRHDLSVHTLLDLLVAFRRDAINPGFAMMDELVEYCRFSANPVGRLVLALFGVHDGRLLELSDRICTGLQMANFWQDLSVDLHRGRINVPRDVLAKYGLTVDDLSPRESVDTETRGMVLELVAVARTFLDAGEEFRQRMPMRRLRWEIAAVVAGGRAILDEIEKSPASILARRPTISKGRIMVRLLLRRERDAGG